jgi:hypothetical protein
MKAKSMILGNLIAMGFVFSPIAHANDAAAPAADQVEEAKMSDCEGDCDCKKCKHNKKAKKKCKKCNAHKEQHGE